MHAIIITIISSPTCFSEAWDWSGYPIYLVSISSRCMHSYLPASAPPIKHGSEYKVMLLILSALIALCVCSLALCFFFSPPVRMHGGLLCITFCVCVCLCVCVCGFTQCTLYTTTTVYGVLVHQEGAICTTKAYYAPWCTRETMFFEKFRGP